MWKERNLVWWNAWIKMRWNLVMRMWWHAWIRVCLAFLYNNYKVGVYVDSLHAHPL